MALTTGSKKSIVEEMCDEITEHCHGPSKFPDLTVMDSVRQGKPRYHAPNEKKYKEQGYDAAEHCRAHKIDLGWEPTSEHKKSQWVNERGEYAAACKGTLDRFKYSSTNQDKVIKHMVQRYPTSDAPLWKQHEENFKTGMGAPITLEEAKEKVSFRLLSIF